MRSPVFPTPAVEAEPEADGPVDAGS